MLREPKLLTCTIRVVANGRVETLREVDRDRVGDVEIAVDDGCVALEGR